MKKNPKLSGILILGAAVFHLWHTALSSEVETREIYMKGIDHSY